MTDHFQPDHVCARCGAEDVTVAPDSGLCGACASTPPLFDAEPVPTDEDARLRALADTPEATP